MRWVAAASHSPCLSTCQARRCWTGCWPWAPAPMTSPPNPSGPWRYRWDSERWRPATCCIWGSGDTKRFLKWQQLHSIAVAGVSFFFLVNFIMFIFFFFERTNSLLWFGEFIHYKIICRDKQNKVLKLYQPKMTEITAEVIVGKPFLWFNKLVSITMWS